jgi:hypothetical protein
MSRKKGRKTAQMEEDEAIAFNKLLCDEALNHMKLRNYSKALYLYNQVSNQTKFTIGLWGSIILVF